MTRGRLFAIKRFALHDGPGIRTTVFLKGCPLRCAWCHNPEGLVHEQQLAFYTHLCVACGKCYEACSSGALQKKSYPAEDYERGKCVLCGKCAEACPAGAIELIGRDMTAEEIIEEVERDRDFYDSSAGGMTVSGGEPLAQADFTRELLSKARELGIHTVLDTCGLGSPEELESCLEFADHVYYDLKAVDDEKHRRLTGSSNDLILDNLRRAAASEKALTLRLPLVKGLNDSPRDISLILDLMGSLPTLRNLRRVEILPYHKTGEGKYKSIGLEYGLKSQEIHSQEELQAVADLFEAGGVRAYCTRLVPPSLGG